MSAGLPAIGNAYDQESMCQAILTATGENGLTYETGSLCSEYLYGATMQQNTARAIRSETRNRGLTYSDSALCAEYACGTVFSSLAAFTHYMQFNDRLQISANQTLVIKGIRVLTDNVSEEPLPSRNYNDDRLSILRRAVAPLARSCQVVSPTISPVWEDDFVCQAKDDFTFRPVRDLEVELTRKPIDMRLSDLYRMMLASSIPRASFTSQQELRIWGQTDAQYTHLRQNFHAKGFGALLTEEIPNVLPGTTDLVQWSNLRFNPIKQGKARGIEMTAGEITFFLEDDYTFDIKEFRERMRIMGEINVPPDQPLVIQDPCLLELFAMYRPSWGEQVSSVIFMLNQMVLSLGKGFIVTPFTYSFSEQEGLKLTNNRDGFKLTLTSSPLFTDIYRLGNQMREDDQMSLTIKAGQQLLIFGIGPNELTSESLATDPNRAFGLYFMRRNPTFFTWDLPFEFNFGRAPHLGCIVIYSDEELTLRLEPSSLIDFMLSLIIGASPSTIQAVKESDPDGFIFILFKSLLYCAMGTTEDSSPYFELFSEATRVKLHVLRAQDPEFAEALSNFLGDEKLRDQMSAILKKNPEGFKALAVDKLPPAVGVVVKKIKALAYGELQAKEFFNCLQAAIQKMNELGM